MSLDQVQAMIRSLVLVQSSLLIPTPGDEQHCLAGYIDS